MKVNLVIQYFSYKINKKIHKYFFHGVRMVSMLQERRIKQAGGKKITNIEFMIKVVSDSTKS